MSQADLLLDMEAGDDLAEHAYPIDDSAEAHIVIGRNRVITVPESLRRIAVQYDNNAESVTFDCPRYWDGVDMSEMSIFVNYARANGDLGKYTCSKGGDDVDTEIDENDPSMMHFRWKIDGHVTLYNGPITIAVCIQEGESEDDFHWNTEINKELSVSEGLEVDEETLAKLEALQPNVIATILQGFEKFTSIKTIVEGYKTAAESAKTAAETAKTEAQEAKTAAETAKTEAESAKTAAETANTEAQKAKTAAVNAASSAANDAKVAIQEVADKAAEDAAKQASDNATLAVNQAVDQAFTHAQNAQNSANEAQQIINSVNTNISDRLKKVEPKDGLSRVYGIRASGDKTDTSINGVGQEEVIVTAGVNGNETYRTIPRREAISSNSSTHPGTFEVEHPQMNPTKEDGTPNAQYSPKHPMTVGVAEKRYALKTESGKLSGPITITKDFGYYTLDGETYKEVGEKDQSIEEFLTNAFCRELQPTEDQIKQPSVKLYIDEFGINVSPSYEVGTDVKPTIMCRSDKGSYPYGPATGVKFSLKYYYESPSGVITEYERNTITGTDNFPTLTIVENELHRYYVSGSHTAGVQPYTNVGKPASDTSLSIIPNESLYSDVEIGVHRKMFYGSTTNSDISIDSGFIRSLNNMKVGYADVDFSASEGDVMLLIAYPSSFTNSTPIFMYEYGSGTGNWKPLNGWIKQTVSVEGAQPDTETYTFSTDYCVWTYTPSNGKFLTDTNIKITIT